MHTNDGHGTGIVRYSVGKNYYDNNLEQREAADFDEFQKAVLSMVSKAKGQQFICSPMSLGEHDKPDEYAGEGNWRLKNRCISRRYIPFDIDGVSTPEVAGDVIQFFSRYRGFGYYTSSSTPENPRFRIVIELSEEVDRREGMVICKTLQAIVLKKFGAESVAFDESVYRGEQPVYTPVGDAESFEFRGKPVDVSAFRKNAPAAAPLKPERKEFPLFQVERLTEERVYPPSSGIEVANQCNQIARMRDTRGVMPEPEWRDAMGVLKHTVEGEALCHEWSKGDPRYTQEDTQKKIDLWVTGPTLCATFEGKNKSLCDNCRFKGKVATPLQLGYVTKVEAPELSQPPEVAKETIDYRSHWPDSFRWDEPTKTLQRRVLNKDGVPEWIPFCDTMFYPITRVEMEDDTWAMRIRMQVSKGRWREFDVPTKQLAQVDALCATLASFEVITKYKMGHHTMTFLGDWVSRFKEKAIEINTFKTFGWHRDFSSFLIGDNLINADGTEVKVIVGSGVLKDQTRDECLVGYGTKGTSEEWARIMNTVYNRPGAEAYQFTIMALLSSPLTALLNIDQWNGIPVAWTGENAQGKTEMGRAACSAYGRPSAFVMKSEKATVNAFDPYIGVMKHLPVVLDELTGRDPKPLLSMLYGLSNGGGKLRADIKGNLSTVGYTWKLISLITGNSNINEAMSELKSHQADAGAVRVFEFAIDDKNYMNSIFGGDDCKTILMGLQENYGVAGRLAIAEMRKDIPKLREDFINLRNRLGYESDDYETEERFFIDLVAQAYLGGKIYQELGLIEWDLDKPIEIAQRQILNMRQMRKANSQSHNEHLAGLLTGLMGSMIITKDMKRDLTEVPMDIAPLRGNRIEARVVIGKGNERFLMSTRYFREWCKEHGVAPLHLKRQLHKDGFIKNPEAKATITLGTSLPSVQENVIEFYYDRVMGVASSPVEVVNKVVNLR